MTYNIPNNKFVFTLHNWTPADWEHLKRFSKENEHVAYLKVAQETGSEGESPHLQGCVYFNSRTFKKQRPSAISKLLMGPNKNVCLPDPKNPGMYLKHHYHVDGMRGTLQEAADYCGAMFKEQGCKIHEQGKIPTTQQGRRTDHEEAQEKIIEAAKAGTAFDDVKLMLPRFADQSLEWMRNLYLQHRPQLENFFDHNPLYKWQKDLATYLNSKKPDPRKILFVVDIEGNLGKTKFALNAQHLIPDKDVFHCTPKDGKSLSSLVPDDGTDIFLIDSPRKVQYDLPYDFIEEVKNGFVTNTKYQCCKKEFKVPHVVVFMNSHPQFGKCILSKDRYVIIEPSLTPEERLKLEQQEEEEQDPYIQQFMERTIAWQEEREVHNEERQEERAAKRARTAQ
ncbi:hypothetical protein SEMRO_1849_G301490.1 [Seminavis robusta]|uniref:CRESS-DNA virus Rep endonuclease domain-containing protein n=1 Tax=Seminavis robusta TaxID=568900 RepID=A0A9N8ER64_9STRA|nr:hypothetical protein SEMRO_1849_G301490.1 [Seminavis robusta]|eukprot:Sro1849_g301490.1 n/a (394) ;mRNA; f:8923-10104